MKATRRKNARKPFRFDELLMSGFAAMQPFQLPVNPWRPIEEEESRRASRDVES